MARGGVGAITRSGLARCNAIQVTPQAQKTGTSGPTDLRRVAEIDLLQILDSQRGRVADVDRRAVGLLVFGGDGRGLSDLRFRNRTLTTIGPEKTPAAGTRGW